MSKAEPGKANEPEVKEKKIKFFTKEFKSERKTISFNLLPALTLEDGMNRLSDQKLLLAAINSAIEEQESQAAKKAAGVEGYNKNVVLDAIKPFREPLSKDGKLVEKGDEGWKELYNAQTDQLIEQIKSIPFIVASIAKKSAEAVETTGDDEQ